MSEELSPMKRRNLINKSLRGETLSTYEEASLNIKMECPICGQKMIHQGTLINRKVQTWQCGGPSPQTHEVTARLRGKGRVD